MVYIIPNFLVLHFGENFMKIQSKISKLQMHENLHEHVNENRFSFTFLCNFHEFLCWAIKATNMLQLYTARYGFNQFRMAFQFFSASDFPKFGPNAFFPTNSTGPWPRLQKGRKIPEFNLYKYFYF